MVTPMPEPQRTDSWPTTGHRCAAAAEAVVYVRFRGPCRDGATASCADCGRAFVYVKPMTKPAEPPAGPRTHF
jgi:hypothetical protein